VRLRLPWRRSKEKQSEEPPKEVPKEFPEEGKAPKEPEAEKGAQIACPFCKVPLSEEHRRNCPALKEVGTLLSFEDYVQFQRAEATATDMESLVMLERMIARGEVPRRASNVMLYVMAAIVAIIGIGIGVYILKSLHVIP